MADKYFPFMQNGRQYNLYDVPEGFVVEGSLYLGGKGLTELPDLSEVIVKGDFYCEDNQLTSLKGAPKKVGGSFSCDNNKLTTLEGASPEVGGKFSCDKNELATLRGAPQTVGDYFSCANNKLINLKGAPQKVGGSFYCGRNRLTTLEGAPKEIGGNFYCKRNHLDSLFGVPRLPGGGMVYCDDALGEKYGFSDSEKNGISVPVLSLSTQYKSEVAADNIRRKQAQERVEKRQNVTEKTKAAYEAWLKDKGIESSKTRE